MLNGTDSGDFKLYSQVGNLGEWVTCPLLLSRIPAFLKERQLTLLIESDNCQKKVIPNNK
jgi:hypothetical protein